MLQALTNYILSSICMAQLFLLLLCFTFVSQFYKLPREKRCSLRQLFNLQDDSCEEKKSPKG
jgi:hypothetical protein